MNMKSMSMYSTQFLVGAPFTWITAAMWRGMESISLWHCSGVMRAQVALIVAFSSFTLLGLAYRIFLFTIPHRCPIGVRSGEFAGQLRTGIPWSLNQVLVALALCAGAKSCWKVKSASPKSWSAAGSIKCSKTSWYTAVLTLDLRKHSGPTPANDMAPQTNTDCGNFTLDLKQHGFCASPLFLQTLGPWFPKEMQNLLSSENITLDHSAAIQSFLSLVWYGNSSNQDCKAMQRVVRLAERISGCALPSLQDIYLKCCKSRAAKILKDSTHPGNHLFCLLPSGKRFRSMMAKTERLRRSFFPQAIRLLNTNPVS